MWNQPITDTEVNFRGIKFVMFGLKSFVFREEVVDGHDARVRPSEFQRTLARSRGRGAFGSLCPAACPHRPLSPYRNASMTLETHAHSEQWGQSIGKKMFVNSLGALRRACL